MEKAIAKKYARDLSHFKAKTFNESLNLLISDLINHSEGVWDYFGIRYDTVMTKDEWKEFSTHPERIPYQTKITALKNKNYDQVYEYILKLLADVYPYYKSLSKSEQKDTLRKNINTLIECSLNARYEDDVMRDSDTYVGRSKEDRDNGNITLTQTSKNRYEYAVNEYAYNTNQDPKKIMQKIMKASDNNLYKIGELLSTCDVDDQLRNDLREISLILSRDLTLEFAEIKLGFNIWRELNEIGIDTENYLELLGLPKYSVVKRRLEDFKNNEDLIQEMELHMKDELPNSYKKFKKDKWIYFREIRAENASRKKYPKKLRSDKEIIDMVEKVKKEIYSYFPLAKIPTPRNILLNPTHPASTSRAFNSTVKNRKGLSVNTIVMTPRSDNIDDYLPTFAHETTHALHKKILDFGETSGVLKKGAADSVPTPVLEDFSQLVDDEFTTDENLPYKKKYNGKEFPNFMAGFGTRFQVPYSLVQLSLRKEFDSILVSGHKSQLTESMIWELKTKFDPLANKWFTMGLDIRSENLTAFGLFAPHNPRDGVVYMKRYMMKENNVVNAVENEQTKKKEQMTMAEAFRKKYGKEWIKNSEARIMLHWLLLETGRNEKTEEYYKFILNKNIEECLTELKKIGLTRKEILG